MGGLRRFWAESLNWRFKRVFLVVNQSTFCNNGSKAKQRLMSEDSWIDECEFLVRGFPDELAQQVTSLVFEAASVAKLGNLTAAAESLEAVRQILIRRNHFRRYQEDIWVFATLIDSIRKQSSEDPVPRAFKPFIESKPVSKLGDPLSTAQKAFWYGSPDPPAGGEIHAVSNAGTSPLASNKNCFIATAAYGSAMAPEVEVLRNFRDTVLLTHPLGDRFVQWYYKISPRCAAWIEPRPQVRKLIRQLVLSPLLFLIGRRRGT
jgi:hypothetical protein